MFKLHSPIFIRGFKKMTFASKDIASEKALCYNPFQC
ncbi:MAG: hypothetical protein K0R18_1033 [Bacillales bacterium]|jgi:hypothetical protein|nr:hypothetical protein [Bacillales bacterium]